MILANPQGNVITLAYDAMGNIRTATNQLPSQNQVEITYKPNGTPATSRDAKSNLTTYGYDSKGNLISLTPPAPLGGVSVTYDSLSRISTVRDGKGQTTIYQYDSLDRVTRATYADGSSVSRSYDPDGNLTSMTDATGITTMTYDKFGQLTERRTPDGRLASYSYDFAGNLLSVTDFLSDNPDSALVVEYGYNPVNLPTSVTSRIVLPSQSTIPLGTMNLTYDANYNRTSLRYPNGVSLYSTYDTSNRLKQISAVAPDWRTLYSIGYGYTNPATSQDTALRFSSSGSDNRTVDYSVYYDASDSYTYDRLNRLATAHMERGRTDYYGYGRSYTADDATYSYDGTSNRTALTKTRFTHNPPLPDSSQTKTSTYIYNPANQLTSADGTTFSYDQNGNLTTSSAGEAYTYNASDQTTSIARPPGAGGFLYRGAGQSERVAALNAPGDPAAVFSYTALGLSSQSDEKTTSYFIRDPRGGLLAWRTPASTYFYLLDGIGSVVGLADSAGTLMARYHYDPFGELAELWTPTSVITDDPLTPSW